MTVELKVEMPEGVFSALRKSPGEFTQAMRLAAAAKWYELGEVSQEKAAEIAGLPRAEFVLALARFRVSPFQYTADEAAAELNDVR